MLWPLPYTTASYRPLLLAPPSIPPRLCVPQSWTSSQEIVIFSSPFSLKPAPPSLELSTLSLPQSILSQNHVCVSLTCDSSL